MRKPQEAVTRAEVTELDGDGRPVAARTSGHSTGRWAGQQGPSRSACRTRGFPHPLSPQDLFVKYAWNNFLHFQVELCIAAILSHSAREDRAVASGPEGAVEPLPSSGDPETPQPDASRPESTMVTHVGPGSVTRVAVSCMSCVSLRVLCILCMAACAEPHPDHVDINVALGPRVLSPLILP